MKKRVVKKRSSRKIAKKATPKKKLPKKNPATLSRKFSSALPRKEFGFPAAYGENRLVLMARDPWWIYAYWEITPKKEREVLTSLSSRNAGAVHRVLRIYRQNGARESSFFDIEIGDFADNWYLEVGVPGALWVSEIGLRSRDGRFYVLARSNSVRTPRYGVSEEIDPEWRLPEEIWNRLLEASGAFLDSKSSFDLAGNAATENKD